MRICLSLLVTLLLCWSASGQTPTTGGGTPPSGTGTTTPRPTTGTTPTTPGGQPPQRQPTFGQDENDPFGRGTGVRGRIVPSMGQRLTVELYLDGMRLDMTFSDMEGNFKFERQQSGRRYEVHVQLGPDQEYVEEVDFNPGFPVMIHIREQNIRSTRPTSKASGTIISLASLKVPKSAEKEFNKGKELGQKKKYEEGLAHLQKSVEIYPSYAEAYNEMGLIHRRQDQAGPAEEMFRKAIEADPKWVYSYLNLASLQLNKNQYSELLQTSRRVLQLNGTLAPAHYFSAVAHASMGNLAEAEKDALAADSGEGNKVPQVHWLLGRLYEARGAKAEAVARYKMYLKENPNVSNAAQVKEAIEKLQKSETATPPR